VPPSSRASRWQPALAPADDGEEFEAGVVSVPRGGPFDTFDFTKNMHPIGFSERTGTTKSDLAFWGDRAYQGNYAGFRIQDVSSPAQPRELANYDECNGNQGDAVVWATSSCGRGARPRRRPRSATALPLRPASRDSTCST
jgi:hypothetical protein